MNRIGQIIRTEGQYRIVAIIADHQDGTPPSIVGYQILGPNGFVSALISLDQAHAELESLLEDAKDNEPGSPSP